MARERKKQCANGDQEKNAKEEADYGQKKAGVGVKCPHCDFIAKNEKGLRSHLGQKHPKWQFYEGDSSSSSEESDGDEEEKKPSGSRSSTSASSSSSSSSTSTNNTSGGKYVCKECGKDCTSGSGLSSHLRSSGHCKAVATPAATDRCKKGR